MASAILISVEDICSGLAWLEITNRHGPMTLFVPSVQVFGEVTEKKMAVGVDEL